MGPRPCSGSLGSARHHRMFRVLPQIGHASSTHLPPVGDQQQPAASSFAAGSSRQPFASLSSPTPSRRAHPSSAASGVFMLQADEPWDHPVPRKIRLPPKVSRLDVRGPKVMRDCVYPPVSVLSKPGIQEEVDLQGDRISVPEIEPSKPVPFNIPEPLSLDVSAREHERGRNAIASVPDPTTGAPLLSQAINSSTVGSWMIGSERLGSQSEIPQHFEFTGASLQPNPSHPLIRTSNSPVLSASSPSRSVRGVKVDSREKVISKSEARDITKTANKATKEPLGSVSNAELLASLAGAAHLPTNMHLLQEDLLRRISPLQRTAAYTVSLPPLLLFLLTFYTPSNVF